MLRIKWLEHIYRKWNGRAKGERYTWSKMNRSGRRSKEDFPSSNLLTPKPHAKLGGERWWKIVRGRDKDESLTERLNELRTGI